MNYLDELDLNLQVETFTAYYKRLNPCRDLKVAFELWVDSKDFSGADKEVIWERVIEEK
jgi:hypothetical protein